MITYYIFNYKIYYYDVNFSSNDIILAIDYVYSIINLLYNGKINAYMNL